VPLIKVIETRGYSKPHRAQENNQMLRRKEEDKSLGQAFIKVFVVGKGWVG
jgi:hypothetical protein